jgi:hypothetical protein
VQLPPIPKSKDTQIKQLEQAVFELTEWLMRELNWDNQSSIADELSDDINKITQRSWDRQISLQ